jgi:hypothetical protein
MRDGASLSCAGPRVQRRHDPSDSTQRLRSMLPRTTFRSHVITADLTVQVEWHLHSPSHFAVLTADNAFSIFSIRQLSTAEQLFKINPLRPAATLSLESLMLEDRGGGPQEMASFAFGSTCGWDPLMVYFMTRYDCNSSTA